MEKNQRNQREQKSNLNLTQLESQDGIKKDTTLTADQTQNQPEEERKGSTPPQRKSKPSVQQPKKEEGAFETRVAAKTTAASTLKRNF